MASFTIFTISVTSFAIALDFAKSYGKVKIKTSKLGGAATIYFMKGLIRYDGV